MPADRLAPADWLNCLLAPASRIDYSGATFLGRWALSAWQIAPRTLDEHLLYWCVQGAAEGAVGEGSARQSIRLTGGHCIWIMPGVPHLFEQAAGCRRLVLYNLRFGLTAGRRHPRLAADCLLAPAPVELESVFARAVEELQQNNPHAATLRKALIAQLAVEIFRAAQTPDDAPATLNRYQRELLQRHVEDHPADRLAPADLARLLDLSPDYFTRLFRRSFQLPPRAWIVRQRIRLAAVALAQSAGNVSQIARQLGYPDVYLFSRQFKQVMGVSPRQYRSQAAMLPRGGRH